jgi:phenylalanyl-tRNA synthetase beta chain
LSGVVVAEVLDIRPHPKADKLRIVRVRAGSREEDVVCGAPNVPPPGNRVCWAQPGARLPGGKTLEAREVRGVMSPGMLCSEPEMGLGEQGDGILILSPSAKPGDDLATFVGAVDDMLEVNVTPNRADALSHLGIARDWPRTLARAFACLHRQAFPSSDRAHHGRRDRGRQGLPALHWRGS